MPGAASRNSKVAESEVISGNREQKFAAFSNLSFNFLLSFLSYY